MVAGQRFCATFKPPHANAQVVRWYHLHNPTGLAPDGLLTCFRDSFQPSVAGRVREGMLTCRRPPYCMPHSHGLSYGEHDPLSCSCHTGGPRNEISRLQCRVSAYALARDGRQPLSTVACALKLIEGPVDEKKQGLAGGPPDRRATLIEY